MKYIAFTFFFVALLLCSCNNNKVNDTQSTDLQTEDTLRTITEEMAYEGVNNYCQTILTLCLYRWAKKRILRIKLYSAVTQVPLFISM